MKNHPIPLSFLVISLLTLAGCSAPKNVITISADSENDKIQFAIDELGAVLLEQGLEVQKCDSKDADIIIALQPENNDVKT